MKWRQPYWRSFVARVSYFNLVRAYGGASWAEYFEWLNERGPSFALVNMTDQQSQIVLWSSPNQT